MPSTPTSTLDDSLLFTTPAPHTKQWTPSQRTNSQHGLLQRWYPPSPFAMTNTREITGRAHDARSCHRDRRWHDETVTNNWTSSHCVLYDIIANFLNDRYTYSTRCGAMTRNSVTFTMTRERHSRGVTGETS